MTKNCKKMYSSQRIIFSIKKLQLYGLGLIRYVQATAQAFHHQKRTSNISKFVIFSLYMFLWVIFALLDPDPA
jgi:hypothetical protein